MITIEIFMFLWFIFFLGKCNMLSKNILKNLFKLSDGKINFQDSYLDLHPLPVILQYYSKAKAAYRHQNSIYELSS